MTSCENAERSPTTGEHTSASERSIADEERAESENSVQVSCVKRSLQIVP